MGFDCSVNDAGPKTPRDFRKLGKITSEVNDLHYIYIRCAFYRVYELQTLSSFALVSKYNVPTTICFCKSMLVSDEAKSLVQDV